MRYLISYDLRKPGQYYEPLWRELETMGAKRVLDSQWAVRVRNAITATELRDHIRRYTDSNDRILIVSIDSTGWAGRNLRNKISSL